MTRINALRNIRETRFISWGKNTGALIFATVLIVCSVTVGCSSDKPKPVSSASPMPVTQAQSPIAPVMPAPAMPAESKPAAKRVVHRRPATVNYADKTYGVTFEYPRRYAIETGNAAADLVASGPLPMNFVQPGGVALAAVELPETSFANTDFSSAFFNVSIHKTLTGDQCNQFSVPQPKVVAPVATTEAASPQTMATSTQAASAQGTSTASTPAATAPSSLAQPASEAATSVPVATPATPSATAASDTVQPAQPGTETQGSKLILGDLELRATEAVTGEGTRQSDSKYFHVFQNGACYEFALNVTTVASEDGLIKHVDRDRVFDRLEKILATVKINPMAAPEVAAEAPATPAVPATPAQ